MITAILVNYFSAGITVRSVLSVLADVPDAQVVVIDNSVDSDQAEQLKSSLPSVVECIVNEENIGFGRACNQAFARSRHDWILLLNPDAYVLNGCIKPLVQFLISHPRVGAVSPLVFWDEDKHWFLPPAQLPTPAKTIVMNLAFRFRCAGRFFSSKFRRYALKVIGTRQAIKQEMLSGGHMLLRKSAINTSGGLFDETFFMFYEDTDLCRRLSENGYSLYLLPSAHAVHEWRAKPEKIELSEVSRRYYFRKHFSSRRFMNLIEKMVQSCRGGATYDYIDTGLCFEPPLLNVPAEIADYWLMELSPHPLFIPALYSFGTGVGVQLSGELWARLYTGEYFVRISRASGGRKSCYFKFSIERED